MAAKSLRMYKSKTIGLIVPNIDNEWFSQLVLKIEKYFFDKIDHQKTYNESLILSIETSSYLLIKIDSCCTQ